MLKADWRKAATTVARESNEEELDILVIGGGIAGAGILRQATKQGLKTLLVEQKDFAWGTSSRSSKMVHGGLRYLKQGKLGLVRDSAKERGRLMEELPGLVDPLTFLFPVYNGDKVSANTLATAFRLYDRIAGSKTYTHIPANDVGMRIPGLKTAGLDCVVGYTDAETDDARLVLRLIQDAVHDGGFALNYAPALSLLEEDGRVCGARIRDSIGGQEYNVKAQVVINATGVWCDQLRSTLSQPVDAKKRMRPLRGSHLVVQQHKLPVAQAVVINHPVDGRPVFVYPWEGAVVIGTTDLDHHENLNFEPHIADEETAYLLQAAAHVFPSCHIDVSDIIATWAGVRPIVDTGAESPSEEPRNHVLWREQGLITVAGGKLTTFGITANEALSLASKQMREKTRLKLSKRVFETTTSVSVDGKGGFEDAKRICGRYGSQATAFMAEAEPEDLSRIPGTETLWCELSWAAVHENVVHLQDLMLRRTRIGLVLPQGGQQHLPRIRQLCQSKLAWSDDKWEAEERAYAQLWRRHYGQPDKASVGDWSLRVPVVQLPAEGMNNEQ